LNTRSKLARLWRGECSFCGTALRDEWGTRALMCSRQPQKEAIEGRQTRVSLGRGISLGQSLGRRSIAWPSRQPPLTENFTFWYVGSLVDQGIRKIRRRVPSAQTNFSSVERTFPEISSSK